jgi:hypothetical protein
MPPWLWYIAVDGILSRSFITFSMHQRGNWAQGGPVGRVWVDYLFTSFSAQAPNKDRRSLKLSAGWSLLFSLGSYPAKSPQ